MLILSERANERLMTLLAPFVTPWPLVSWNVGSLFGFAFETFCAIRMYKG
jgi:hypothetical protein